MNFFSTKIKKGRVLVGFRAARSPQIPDAIVQRCMEVLSNYVNGSIRFQLTLVGEDVGGIPQRLLLSYWGEHEYISGLQVYVSHSGFFSGADFDNFSAPSGYHTIDT